MLNERFPLKRGHRPAMCWVPLGMPLGQGTLWEQTLAMGLARQYGWCGDEDWFAIRAGLLGAAARGVQVIEDERAIAAGRLWLNWIDDEQATRILKRPTVKYDPIAKAIEAYGELIHKPTETTLTE